MILLASGIDHDPLPEGERGDCHVYAPGEKITRLEKANIRDAVGMGFKVLQIAAGEHFNQDIGPDGRVPWRPLEENLRLLAENGAEALLVAGFYWVPPSLREDRRVVTLRCCQHGKTIPMFSLWDEFSYEWIGRCIEALRQGLARSPARVRAIAAMVYGDFGEAIFPAGMLNAANGFRPVSGIDLHNHGDFWCNDPAARRSYARFVADSAGGGGAGPDPEGADLFPSRPGPGEPARRWIQFVRWYHDSMTRHAARVVELFRAAFPELDIVIWLGGGIEPPQHGQDNTALPKAMAGLRGTIRSTASAAQQIARELSPQTAGSAAWCFQRNYPLVKRIASACRHYGTPLWFEPPYPPGLSGPSLAARAFEALSCGASGYFEWTRTLQRQRAMYQRLVPLLQQERGRSVVEAAVYYPQLWHWVSGGTTLPEPYWTAAAHLRAVLDYDVLDDRLIADGALDRFKLLVAPQLGIVEPAPLARIERWVEAGGIVVGVEAALELPEDPSGTSRGMGAPPMLFLKSGWATRKHPSPQVPGEGEGGVQGRPATLGRGPSPNRGPAGGTLAVAHGSGACVLCPAGISPLEFASAVRDLLADWPALGHLRCRAALPWSSVGGEVFTTFFENSVLLANLSPAPVKLNGFATPLLLDGYDLRQVELATT